MRFGSGLAFCAVVLGLAARVASADLSVQANVTSSSLPWNGTVSLVAGSVRDYQCAEMVSGFRGDVTFTSAVKQLIRVSACGTSGPVSVIVTNAT
jgi:hypothetical protein